MSRRPLSSEHAQGKQQSPPSPPSSGAPRRYAILKPCAGSGSASRAALLAHEMRTAAEWRGGKQASQGAAARGREGSQRLVSVVKAIAQSGKESADDEDALDDAGDDDEWQAEMEL